MPTLKFTVPLLAGAVNNNVLAGSVFEFIPINPPTPSAVVIYAVQDGDVLSDLTLGTNIIGTDLEPNLEVGAGLGPDRQSDLLVSGVGAPADRIQLRARNTDAANPQVVRFIIDIRPL